MLAPPRAFQLQPGLGGLSQMQPRREESGHAPRVAAPTHENDEKKGGGTGPSGSFAADATRVGGSGPPPPAAAAARRRGRRRRTPGLGPGFRGGGLRDYERRLGEKEAHLKMPAAA